MVAVTNRNNYTKVSVEQEMRAVSKLILLRSNVEPNRNTHPIKLQRLRVAENFFLPIHVY